MRGFLSYIHYTFIEKVLFKGYLTKYQQADNGDKEEKDEIPRDPQCNK